MTDPKKPFDPRQSLKDFFAEFSDGQSSLDDLGKDSVFFPDDIFYGPSGLRRNKMPEGTDALLMLEILLTMKLLSREQGMQNLQTTEERQRWIEDNFGQLEIIPSGKDYVVALPEGYHMDFDSMSGSADIVSMLDNLMGVSSTRMKCIPNRIEVKADSRDDGIGRLYNQVRHDGYVNVYAQKPGQDSSVLVSGKPYFVIKRSDPLHNHASVDLIDFITCEIDPVRSKVLKGSLEGSHSHLIDPKFVL